MRYDQGREQSKKILKQAVSYMGRQHASFDPASYTLWYEHAAGLNPALSQVLDERLTSQRPLTDADVSRLYTQYVASRELQAIEQIQARLVAHLQDISRELSDTGTHAAQFGLQLEHHGEQLKATSSIDSIESIVGELLGETHKMVAMHRTMARHLETRASDVQSLTTRLQQAEADALGDPLTGLLNRRGFEQAARDGTSPSGQLRSAALLLVDVDEFKNINDTHGHQAGDQVLRGMAQILRARIKGADIAARLGGDEFAVLLPDTTLIGAVAVAEQIRKAVSQTRLRRPPQEEVLGRVSVSIGVSHTGDEATLESLLSRADAALYEAKRGGRNQVRMTAERDSLN